MIALAYLMNVFRYRVLVIGSLILSTLFSIGLLFIRWAIAGHPMFHWLVWDLFLAWMPMWIAMVIYALHIRGCANRGLLISLGIAWLLFLPNAPYLLTEFVHLGRRHHGVWWCDLVLTVGVAWNGLLLGLLSLFTIHHVLRERVGVGQAAWMTAGALALCSFGIALGRFQRFNSWDVIRHPIALVSSLADQFIHPLNYRKLFAMAVLLFGFLSLAYLTLCALVFLRQDERKLQENL